MVVVRNTNLLPSMTKEKKVKLRVDFLYELVQTETNCSADDYYPFTSFFVFFFLLIDQLYLFVCSSFCSYPMRLKSNYLLSKYLISIEIAIYHPEIILIIY